MEPSSRGAKRRGDPEIVERPTIPGLLPPGVRKPGGRNDGRGSTQFGLLGSQPSVLDHTYIRRGRVLHADDMVARVDMENFAGDAARHRRQEINRALADLLDGHRAAQGRVVFVPPQYVTEVADAGGGERLDRAGRDRVDANALLAQIGR